MALNAPALGQLIHDNLVAMKLTDPGSQKLADAIAQAVVTHILSSAEVIVATAQLGVVPGQTGGPVPLAPTILKIT